MGDIMYAPSADTALFGGLLAVSAVVWVICIALCVLMLVAYWKLFQKAGEPGWACLVPFYSNYVLFKIAFGNGWLFLLSLVPIVNVVVALMLPFKLAKAFGKDVGWGFGLLFLSAIFYLLLGFGSAEYVGN